MNGTIACNAVLEARSRSVRVTSASINATSAGPVHSPTTPDPERAGNDALSVPKDWIVLQLSTNLFRLRPSVDRRGLPFGSAALDASASGTYSTPMTVLIRFRASYTKWRRICASTTTAGNFSPGSTLF